MQERSALSFGFDSHVSSCLIISCLEYSFIPGCLNIGRCNIAVLQAWQLLLTVEVLHDASLN